jgi:ATP-dependent protease HslVU (ClpYQ) ATPase subunit
MAIYCSTTLDQGRLPIRVTLKGLSQEDMYRILTEPVTNLIRQQVEMLKSEDVTLAFTEVLHVEITAWIKSTSILD